MAPRTDFPPIRAVIFDMDGLLIDSEDQYTAVTNTILQEHNRPLLPWSIKAQLQGRPGPAAGKIFQAWAKLPISTEEFMKRQKELQAEAFKKCQPLPGVKALLARLSSARSMIRSSSVSSGNSNGSNASNSHRSWQERVLKAPGFHGDKLQMAVATSSHSANFEIKTRHMKKMFEVFPERQVIVGDDDRIPKGRGKPLPDIYLLALQVINDGLLDGGEKKITPEECLVFEDSVPGIEAGRRAGMRVVWCPHPGLLEVYQDRVAEVLAGATGEHKEGDLEQSDSKPMAGSPGQVGEIDDGWGERLDTLEDFDYLKYGIDITDERLRSESGQLSLPGTTDKELEEMTARADGKLHAREEGSGYNTPVRGTASPIPGLLERSPKI